MLRRPPPRFPPLPQKGFGDTDRVVSPPHDLECHLPGRKHPRVPSPSSPLQLGRSSPPRPQGEHPKASDTPSLSPPQHPAAPSRTAPMGAAPRYRMSGARSPHTTRFYTRGEHKQHNKRRRGTAWLRKLQMGAGRGGVLRVLRRVRCGPPQAGPSVGQLMGDQLVVGAAGGAALRLPLVQPEPDDAAVVLFTWGGGGREQLGRTDRDRRTGTRG